MGTRRGLARLVAGAALVALASPLLAGTSGASAEPRLVFVSPATATAHVGVHFAFDPYARTVGGAQSTAFYDVSGALPPGVTSDPLTGISGTPAAGSAGTYALTFYANLPYERRAIQHFVLTVSSAPAPQAPEMAPLAVSPRTTSVPPSVSYASPDDRAELGNDTLGDCVEAAEAHLGLDQLRALGEPAPTPSLARVVADYYAVTGGAAGPEVGSSIYAALGLWSTAPIAGTRAVAAGALPPHSRPALRAAIDQLGGVVASLSSPASFVEHAGESNLWRAVAGVTVGGTHQISHEVAVVGYDPTGPLVSSWGKVAQATWAWWEASVRDVTAVVTTALVHAGHGPTGIPVQVLLARWTGAGSAA